MICKLKYQNNHGLFLYVISEDNIVNTLSILIQLTEKNF